MALLPKWRTVVAMLLRRGQLWRCYLREGQQRMAGVFRASCGEALYAAAASATTAEELCGEKEASSNAAKCCSKCCATCRSTRLCDMLQDINKQPSKCDVTCVVLVGIQQEHKNIFVKKMALKNETIAYDVDDLEVIASAIINHITSQMKWNLCNFDQT